MFQAGGGMGATEQGTLVLPLSLYRIKKDLRFRDVVPAARCGHATTMGSWK